MMDEFARRMNQDTTMLMLSEQFVFESHERHVSLMYDYITNHAYDHIKCKLLQKSTCNIYHVISTM